MSTTKKPLTLADKLKVARKSVGLSQKDLGDALHLSDKAVSSYEVGRAQPSVETIRQISHLTHKPLTYFLEEGETDEMELEMRFKNIERELQEVKQLLLNRNKARV